MLSPRERVILDTLLPSRAHPTLKHGIFDAGFDEFYADFDKTALLSLRLGFKAALFAALWVSPFLIKRLPPLSRHDRQTRERGLEALGQSSLYFLRQTLLLLKAVVSFGYGADAAVREAVGFPRQFDASRP